MWSIPRFCAPAIALALMTPAAAGELAIHAGSLHGEPGTEPTYSFALEYRRPFGEHVSGSFTWLNEGHFAGHHRDGQAVQLWLHTAPVDQGAVFAVGVGPYHYLDTVVASNIDGYDNLHGWGLLASASATWYFDRQWFTSLRINRVQVPNTVSSTAIVAGLGYRFGATADAAPGMLATSRTADTGRWEVDALYGTMIVNSFASETDFAAAKGIGLRVRMTDHLTGSLTYLDEGDTSRERRDGFAPQVWLEDNLTDRLSVGVGFGPYFVHARQRHADGRRDPPVSGLISVTSAYAFTPDWTGRVVWNRVSTQDSSDSDVIMLGLGYRF